MWTRRAWFAPRWYLSTANLFSCLNIPQLAQVHPARGLSVGQIVTPPWLAPSWFRPSLIKFLLRVKLLQMTAPQVCLMSRIVTRRERLTRAVLLPVIISRLSALPLTWRMTLGWTLLLTLERSFP